MTLAQAIARLQRTQIRMQTVLERSAHELGAACVARAQSKLGNIDQPAVNLVIPGVGGPFDAWEPLADETIERKLREGFPTPAPLKRTGDMGNSIHYTVEAHPQGVVVRVRAEEEYAVYQEFGTATIP